MCIYVCVYIHVYIYVYMCVCVCVCAGPYVCHSVMSNLLWPNGLSPPQAPLSMGILQARILVWVAMPSSRWFSQTRDRTQVSRNVGRFFTIWATRETQEYWDG